MNAWEEFIRDHGSDFIGGEVESNEDGVTYRGPIAAIEIKGDCVYISGPWNAKNEHGKWIKNPINVPLFVNVGIVNPRLDHLGRLQFALPFLGAATLYPKTWPVKLDPKLVEGLNENP